MEKPINKAKMKFLKLIPRAASAVAFHSQLFSPTRETNGKLKAHAGSIIPAAARIKPKELLSFEPALEPTSPKVSCMGQIKHKKKLKKEKKKQVKDFQKINRPNQWAIRNSDAAASPAAGADSPDRAPTLSQMKRFASGREWVGRAEYSGEESEEEEEEDRPEVIIPFSAPILVSGGGGGDGDGVDLKPRKEINLWKRRTMAQPRPLQVHTIVGST